MLFEIFKTKREFDNKFKSGLFQCPCCKRLTNDKKYCSNCNWRADGLLKTFNQGYKYQILETNEIEEIFKPIELLKETK